MLSFVWLNQFWLEKEKCDLVLIAGLTSLLIEQKTCSCLLITRTITFMVKKEMFSCEKEKNRPVNKDPIKGMCYTVTTCYMCIELIFQ